MRQSRLGGAEWITAPRPAPPPHAPRSPAPARAPRTPSPPPPPQSAGATRWRRRGSAQRAAAQTQVCPACSGYQGGRSIAWGELSTHPQPPAALLACSLPTRHSHVRAPVHRQQLAQLWSFRSEHPQNRVLAILPRYMHGHASGLVHSHRRLVCGHHLPCVGCVVVCVLGAGRQAAGCA